MEAYSKSGLLEIDVFVVFGPAISLRVIVFVVFVETGHCPVSIIIALNSPLGLSDVGIGEDGGLDIPGIIPPPVILSSSS